MVFSNVGMDVKQFNEWQYSLDMEICNMQFQLAQLTKGLKNLEKEFSMQRDNKGGASLQP